MADPDLTLKQHDTYPPLRATLSASDGPIDLTTATQVKVILRTDAVILTGVCTIENAPLGVVRYDWAVGDLAVAGDYDGEFEITWNTGRIETVPNDDYILFRVKADLG